MSFSPVSEVTSEANEARGFKQNIDLQTYIDDERLVSKVRLEVESVFSQETQGLINGVPWPIRLKITYTGYRDFGSGTSKWI